jgi:hypothetical protein
MFSHSWLKVRVRSAPTRNPDLECGEMDLCLLPCILRPQRRARNIGLSHVKLQGQDLRNRVHHEHQLAPRCMIPQVSAVAVRRVRVREAFLFQNQRVQTCSLPALSLRARRDTGFVGAYGEHSRGMRHGGKYKLHSRASVIPGKILHSLPSLHKPRRVLCFLRYS